VQIDEAAITRADRFRESLLLPEESRRYRSKSFAGGFLGGLVGGTVVAASMKASLPAVRDYLIVRPGQWQMSITGEGLLFTRSDERVLVRWSDVVVWAKSKFDLMIATKRNGRVVIPTAGLPDQIVNLVVEALSATKATKRKATAKGQIGKFGDIGTGEKIVRVIVLSVGGVVLLLSALIFLTVWLGV